MTENLVLLDSSDSFMYDLIGTIFAFTCAQPQKQLFQSVTWTEYLIDV